jgi:hypothetical protein
LGFRLRVLSAGCETELVAGFMVYGLGFRVQGLGVRVKGLGFRV